MKKIDCFKPYDVCSRVPEELDEGIAYRIGRGYAEFVKPRTVAVGREIRSSSPAITAALMKGLTDSGVDVLDIGIGGTELDYFTTFSRRLDGGIMVTASHYPPNCVYRALPASQKQLRAAVRRIDALRKQDSLLEQGVVQRKHPALLDRAHVSEGWTCRSSGA